MSDLVDRLTTHRTLRGVPRRELEWLAAHGELRRFDRGDIALRKDEPIAEMFIQLSGRVSSILDRSTGRRPRARIAWRRRERPLAILSYDTGHRRCPSR